MRCPEARNSTCTTKVTWLCHKCAISGARDPQVFAATIVRVLRGGGDGREQAARAYAREHLDWRRIVGAAAAEIAKRAGSTGEKGERI